MASTLSLNLFYFKVKDYITI